MKIMKTRMILFTLLICPLIVLGQTWDYPIRPGTEEWKALKNNQEKVLVCQIPQEILNAVSTNELLELCIKYPLLNDIYAFNDTSEGLNKLIKDFNGIRELLSRKDIDELLLNKYSKQLDNELILDSKDSNFDKGEYIVLISTLELLLSIDEIQIKLPLLSKKKIMSELWRGYEMKKTKNIYFQGIGFKTNFSAMSRILSSAEENKALINSLSKGNYDDKLIETIDTETQKFIKK